MLRNSRKEHSLRRMQIAAWVLILCILFMQIPVYSAVAAAEGEGQANLLVNPDWIDGTDGWEITAGLEATFPDGRPAQQSDIYQELSLEGYQEGQVITFSGLIGTAMEDPTQELISMSLALYGADGSLMENAEASEESTELTFHEVSLAIPAGAAVVRASLSIYKQGADNIANFDSLLLEIGPAPASQNAGGFIKTGNNTAEPETITSGSITVPKITIPKIKQDTEEPEAETPALTTGDITGVWYLQEQYTDDPQMNNTLQSADVMKNTLTLNEDGTVGYDLYDDWDVSAMHLDGSWTYNAPKGYIVLSFGGMEVKRPFNIEGDKMILEEEGAREVYGREKPKTTELNPETEPEAATEPETKKQYTVNLGQMTNKSEEPETTAVPAYFSEYVGTYEYYCMILTPEYMEKSMEMYGIGANDVGNRYVWMDGNFTGMTIELYADGSALSQMADGSQSHVTWYLMEDGVFYLNENDNIYTGSLVNGFLTLDLAEDASYCFAADGATLPAEVLEYEDYFYLLYDMEDLADKNAAEEGGLTRAEINQLVETGKGYFYGTGPEGFDMNKATEYFLDAAEAVSGEAMYYIGWTLLCSAEPDRFARAMTMFQDAEIVGCKLGLIGQGNMYRNGYGVEKDYNKAMELYQSALDQGCIEAYISIGYMFEKGFGVEADGQIALECYTKALDSDKPEWRNQARDAIGRIYQDGAPGIDQDYAQSLWWYSQAAEEGDGNALDALGYIYYFGLGVETDIQASFNYYYQAAVHGSTNAFFNVGVFYNNGFVVERDYGTAFQWYLQAANYGDLDGMIAVGEYYEYGKGTSVDYTEARRWYTEALNSAGNRKGIFDSATEALARLDGYDMAQDTGYDTSDYYDYDYDYNTYENETQPWESPYFIGYTQDGRPQYSYDTYETETQPWESPYFIGYTQDGTPQYSYDTYYDTYQYETQPWEDPYFAGYTQDGTPQYYYDTYDYYDYYNYYQPETQPWEDPYFIGYKQDGTPEYSNR